MPYLSHWLVVNGSILAALVTVEVAVLLVCCVESTRCPKREKERHLRPARGLKTLYCSPAAWASGF